MFCFVLLFSEEGSELGAKKKEGRMFKELEHTDRNDEGEEVESKHRLRYPVTSQEHQGPLEE